HVDAVLVGGVDEIAEVLPRPEVPIDVEEVLDTVAMIACGLERDLAEDRAHPEGSDAKTFQVSELALQPLQRAPLPRPAGLEPGVVGDPSRVTSRIEPRRARSYRTAVVVTMAAALIAIGESIDEQKIEHLVFPGSRRRGELPSGQLGEVEVQQTFFDLLGHGG